MVLRYVPAFRGHGGVPPFDGGRGEVAVEEYRYGEGHFSLSFATEWRAGLLDCPVAEVPRASAHGLVQCLIVGYSPRGIRDASCAFAGSRRG